jgi:hypothetical protein
VSGDPYELYDSFANELAARFRRVGNLVSHAPSTGNYHEDILRDVLRNFLSKRFSIKTGFVYKDAEQVSNQIDILVVDEYDASAYIFQEGEFAIVRPQSVVAAIEVKTKLTRMDFPRFRGHLSAWVERPGQGGSSAELKAAVPTGVSS